MIAVQQEMKVGDFYLLDHVKVAARGPLRDVIWPADNEYGIPTLRLDRQGNVEDLRPFYLWGRQSRTRFVGRGTYAFYVADYKFDAVWYKAHQVVNSGISAIVEPNYTTGPLTPQAVAIWNTYRKRWLARYWQEQGVKVWVDINVNARFTDLNSLGVPLGWRSFMTRGYDSHVLELESQLAWCRAFSNEAVLVVYGGGKIVRRMAARLGLIFIPKNGDETYGK